MSGADLANPVARTATNPFQSQYAWGKAELVDFNSTIGRPLQAILYHPANYDPSKKYPLVVYTYELLSQGLHSYSTPRETDYYNTQTLVQRGDFVLMPDIVFRPREPGISDMISFAGQMHRGSVPEFDHWETGQFRMQVAPWEDFDAMLANSPLNRVHQMPAKSMLIEIGSEDPVVDMRQGVLLYNYARRAGKQAVMLNYPGEGHGLGKRENQIDYHRRIQDWFAHYLKGEPAAAWITEGQTWLDRKRILDANKP